MIFNDDNSFDIKNFSNLNDFQGKALFAAWAKRVLVHKLIGHEHTASSSDITERCKIVVVRINNFYGINIKKLMLMGHQYLLDLDGMPALSLKDESILKLERDKYNNLTFVSGPERYNEWEPSFTLEYVCPHPIDVDIVDGTIYLASTLYTQVFFNVAVLHEIVEEMANACSALRTWIDVMLVAPHPSYEEAFRNATSIDTLLKLPYDVRYTRYTDLKLKSIADASMSRLENGKWVTKNEEWQLCQDEAIMEVLLEYVLRNRYDLQGEYSLKYIHNVYESWHYGIPYHSINLCHHAK